MGFSPEVSKTRLAAPPVRDVDGDSQAVNREGEAGITNYLTMYSADRSSRKVRRTTRVLQTSSIGGSRAGLDWFALVRTGATAGYAKPVISLAK